MTTEMLKSLEDAPCAPEDLQPGQTVYDVFRELRETAPVARTHIGVTLALRNRHVALLTNGTTRQIELETKIMQGIVDGPIYDFTRLAMLFANDDVHIRRRTPVARTFAFKLMDAMRPRIRALAEEMITARLGKGPIDFVGDIAAQLPARIIAEILGIPDKDIPIFLQWIQDTADALGIVDANQREKIETSLTEFMAYVTDLLEARRSDPQGDFLSDYVRATAEAGNLEEGEIRTQILGLILAGSDTTRGSMCMTLSEMLQRPDQWADFVADTEGLKRAVIEEGLRYQPVISGIPRVTLRDLDVDGYRIPEGAVIVVSIMSALRDPDVFSDPETFNIHRTDQQRWHLVFGAGAHRCVGEALARAEMEEMLAAIARVAPNTKLIGPPPHLVPGAIRQVSPMQVAFEA
ncbi:MAG: cytochrome P450 [Pseudomonadota bacterium]